MEHSHSDNLKINQRLQKHANPAFDAHAGCIRNQNDVPFKAGVFRSLPTEHRFPRALLQEAYM
jgi:hypothetical protein